ncbi:MAG: putative transport system ATP-binding protein [Thermoanaerobaculia bacterium]|jgi:putative ABC transport system ATP-binding protein|nr:putative transport system ATP-binding protein [Thermoanaerobaculia bacterium]
MRIRLEHVTHAYAGSDESAAVEVLRDVSLDIASGDFAVLMGASGSGKSTLLNLIGAVDKPTSGRIFLDDAETSLLDDSRLTMLRRRSIGYIFQFFNLIPTLNVFENVAFPLSLANTPRSEVKSRVAAALADVGLGSRATHYPNELSGGEMQRAAIARAIIHNPPLILADEPTGNLDSKNGEMILDLIRTIHATRRPTIVMATHSDRAAAIGDYVIEVVDGRAYAAGVVGRASGVGATSKDSSPETRTRTSEAERGESGRAGRREPDQSHGSPPTPDPRKPTPAT